MHNNDVCPNCGEFAELDDYTGWCNKCSGIAINRKIEWLKRNADQIEAWLLNGLTIRQAVVVVIERNRPTCLNCGNPIRHGTNGRHILCNATPECKKARRRYKYLVYDKGYSKERALRVVLGLEREAA